MARTDTLNNYLVDISLAIKQKRNITDNIYAKDFDEEILKISESDGISINGTLKEYRVKTNGEVNSGDFVSHTRKLFDYSDDSEINTSKLALSTQCKIISVELTKNKILILDMDSANTYMIGALCHIENENIIVDSKTILSTDSDSGVIFSMVKVSDKKVFISHRNGSNYLCAMIISVDNDTLTVLNDTVIVSNNYSYYHTTTKMSDNKILMTLPSDNYNYAVYGLICTINDDNTLIIGDCTRIILRK